MSESPASGVPSPLVLDAAQLDAVCDGDREFESMLCGKFRISSVAALDELAESVAARDAASAKARAHAIKGSAATLGGQALAGVCQRIETLAAADPDWDLLSSLLTAARAELERLDLAFEARAGAQ